MQLNQYTTPTHTHKHTEREREREREREVFFTAAFKNSGSGIVCSLFSLVAARCGAFLLVCTVSCLTVVFLDRV